jgi:hypothetical protein
MRLRLLIGTMLVCSAFLCGAQTAAYPRNYFRNPLDIPMELAANFGELRPNHWHMGLDIRTKQKENLPIYAAAGGYIAHVGIRPQSFGRFIIINHPNGLSTLYAHLNDFFPELEEYVTDQQYKEEKWALELDFAEDKFPVHKGAFIAYSGNTGGSQGPHLHFEIRDTKTDKCLNPLLFGFNVSDNVSPSLVKLAVYDRSRSVYDQTPLLFNLKKTDSGYIIPKTPIIKTGRSKLSFAIQAYDVTTGSKNPNGIFSARLLFDGEPIVGFLLDSLDYNETSYMNAHVDYKFRHGGGAYLQHLSQLPGDNGVVYRQWNGDGVITFNDTNSHTVEIEVKDVYQNSSLLKFQIVYSDSLEALLPQRTTADQKFVPGNVNVVEKDDFELYMPEGCIYDTIATFYYRNNSIPEYGLSALHQVNDVAVPVHEELVVRIKPTREVPDDWKDKLIIQRGHSRGRSLKKAEAQGEWFTARFSDFGSFQLLADVVAPEVNAPGKLVKDTIDLSPANRIVFLPTDNFGVIKNFRVELNGKWLRFTNDKSRYYIYKFDERVPYGVHELKVIVEDLVGNTTTRTWWFKKYPYTPPKKKIIKKKKGSKKPVSKTKKSSTKR